MPEKIRELTDKDFLKISAIFDFGKSVDELKWLFANPNKPNSYNALVALNEKGRLIGVIGYIISDYFDENKKISGVIPMSWKIIPGYKGFSGILLMKNALSKGQFAFTIGGTSAALALYPMFRLNNIFKGYKFYKIFNLWQFFFSLKDNFIRKIAKTIILLPAFFGRINSIKMYDDVYFVCYDGNNLINEKVSSGVFQKQISEDYINWLLRCPILESYCFNIMKGTTNLGVCIFFISEINGIKRGRIVYIPFLGQDLKLWKTVLHKSFEFFKSKKCCCVSAFTTNKTMIYGLSTSMFKFIKSQKIFVKDTRKELKEINLYEWNIQFAEGDTVYLNI